MVTKKDNGRFTFGFNPNDPQHRIVIDLLNEQGRKKAQFLVNAVLHYLHCPKTPDIGLNPLSPVDEKQIKRIVLTILQKEKNIPLPNIQPDTTIPQPFETKPQPVMNKSQNSAYSAIASTLAEFRQK